MNIILLGAPGAGKGTQAEIISQHLNIPTISTGDMFRNALKSGTEMGLKAKSYMDSGNLVPDEVVIGMVKERIKEDDCKNGFILDGCPRTIPQAEALDEMGVNIDLVIDIEVKDDVIINRMSGRRVCEKCGKTYHIKGNPSKMEGVCDVCTGALIQRKDDQPETVKARLEEYHEKTEPLKDYYSKQNKLKVIEGQDSIEETSALVFEVLS
ncbi:MAG: adenylate kinase [Acutalibacteraceae bacterium]